jgi:hypothetical protein
MAAACAIRASRLAEMDGHGQYADARLEKMGGRFAIAGQAGRGTILRFYLPLNGSL